MRITKSFRQFYECEKSGALLLACTVLSLLLANSSFLGESYVSFWHTHIGMMSIEQWVNDALMAVFFLMIGLELKRELLVGELSSPRTGLLPVFAALGGMVIPVIIYLSLNAGTNTIHGFGIPMATDIAFALGVLSLLGKSVSFPLKVFLTAIAVIDDLGAILIIALFYSGNISWTSLALVAVLFCILLLLNRLKINSIYIYLLLGAVMWYFMFKSGVHATLSGILLAFVLPFQKGTKKSLSYRTQLWLHAPVAMIVLPVFALANTAIVFGPQWDTGLLTASSLGIILGLVLGKPIGIFLFSFFSVKSGMTKLPEGVKWNQVLGIGLLAGIGFTMSIFITLLAFTDESHITESKISILCGSLISGIAGYVWLKMILQKKNKKIINV